MRAPVSTLLLQGLQNDDDNDKEAALGTELVRLPPILPGTTSSPAQGKVRSGHGWGSLMDPEGRFRPLGGAQAWEWPWAKPVRSARPAGTRRSPSLPTANRDGGWHRPRDMARLLLVPGGLGAAGLRGVLAPAPVGETGRVRPNRCPSHPPGLLFHRAQAEPENRPGPGSRPLHFSLGLGDGVAWT